MECIVHYDDVCESDLKKLTETTFNTLKKCAVQWLSLDGIENTIASKNLQLWDINLLSDLPPSANAFHRKCYSRFTNKKNIERRISSNSKRKLLEGNSAQKSENVPTKVLRSSSSFQIREKNRPHHLLPVTCIICGKKERNLKKSQQIRMGKKKDLLCVALTKDAG